MNTRQASWERRFNVVGLAAMHIGAVLAMWMGARPIDLAICFGLYFVRMFAITAGYHRYFAHKGYKTSRVFQFLLALVGTTATQKGPLWWAAIHRRHHRESDGPKDVHSPVQRGFFWAHVGWFLANEHEEFEPSEVKDLWGYPELRWLDRFHVIPVLALLLASLAFGGLRGLCWWYCASTVLLLHGTFTINSLAHVWGHRRFNTTDDSRNNPVLALITLGEGWHNNHHRYMQTANQGFYWWQVDISYYLLQALSFVGVTWDLRTPPRRILDEGRKGNPAPFVKTSEPRAPSKGAALGLPQPADAE
jgi:stearoyl-CoA desaturase (delta-9 desaturase)